MIFRKEIRRKIASIKVRLPREKGGKFMASKAKKSKNRQKEKQQERAVYAIGRPSLEQLSKDEQKAFYSTLLLCVCWNMSEKEIEAERLF